MSNFKEALCGALAVSLVAGCSNTSPSAAQLTINPSRQAESLDQNCARQGVVSTAHAYETPLNLALGRTYKAEDGGTYTLTFDGKQFLTGGVLDLEKSKNHPLTASIGLHQGIHLELTDGTNNVAAFKQTIDGDVKSCNVLLVRWLGNKFQRILFNGRPQMI